MVRDPNGQARFVVGAFIDLTEQRHADNALQQQVHFTRALLDAIPNPVYFKDRDGRYGVYNRAFDELFGGGRDWIGKTVHDMFPGSGAVEHESRDKPLYERPASTTYEMMVPTSDGDDTRTVAVVVVGQCDDRRLGEDDPLPADVHDHVRGPEVDADLASEQALSLSASGDELRRSQSRRRPR